MRPARMPASTLRWTATAVLFSVALAVSSCSNNSDKVQTSSAGAPISQAQANATGGMNPKMEKKFGADAGGAKAPAAAAPAATAPMDQAQ